MIHAYVSGFASSNKDASASVLLLCGDYKYEQTIDLIDMDMRRAELLAALLALDVIKHRHISTVLHTDSDLIYSMLERRDGQWVNPIRIDAEVVNELRKTAMSFEQLDVTMEAAGQEIAATRDACRHRHKLALQQQTGPQ